MTEPNEPTYIVVQQPPTRRRIPRWAFLAFGALVLAGLGAGTFASFTASTRNSATFATGSLVLTNKVNTGTTCLSAVGGNTDTNDNAACDALFTLATKKPGDTATTNLDLKHDGTIDASALTAFVGSACAASDAAGETYHGSGNPCGSAQLTLMEFADATKRTNLDATGGTCWYGGSTGAGSLCTFSAAKTLTDFSTAYPNFGTSLALGAMANQTTRYFQLGIKLDPTAGNDMQGRTATIALSWRIVQ